MKLGGVMAAVALAVLGCGEVGATTVGPSTVPPPDLAAARVWMVMIGPNGTNTFSPSTITIKAGDTVVWTWAYGLHTVTSGTPGNVDGRFCSVPPGTVVDRRDCDSIAYAQSTGATYAQTDAFRQPGTYPYFCMIHGAQETGTVVSVP